MNKELMLILSEMQISINSKIKICNKLRTQMHTNRTCRDVGCTECILYRFDLPDYPFGIIATFKRIG